MNSPGPPPYNVYSGSDGVTNVVEVLSRRLIGLVLDYSYQQEAFVIKRSTVSNPGGLVEGDLLVSVNNHSVLQEALEDVYALLQMIQLSADLEPMRLTFLSLTKCTKATYTTAMEKDSAKDKFGFRRNVHYLIKEDAAEKSRDSKHEQKRDEDFVGYLKQIGGVQNLMPGGRCNEELSTVIRKGVPIAYRGSVWSQLSQANHHRRHLGENYYEQCLREAENALPHQTKIDIEKDLDRTFPDHDHFRRDGGEAALHRVLTAYAIHNSDVGYCQGLNFVAGVLLLYCEEKEAFFILVATLGDLLPSDYYSRALLGHQVDQAVLKELVRGQLPRIHRKLEEERIELALVTVPWFLPLFTNTLRHDVSLRVLDIFFAEGSTALFRVALALFQLNENEILAACDHTELFMCLRELGSSVTSADELISVAYPAQSRNHTSYRSSSPISGFGLAHLGFSASSDQLHLPEKEGSNFTPARMRSHSEQISTTTATTTVVAKGRSPSEVVKTPDNRPRRRMMSLDVTTTDTGDNTKSTGKGIIVSPSSLLRSLSMVTVGSGSGKKNKGAHSVEDAEVDRLRNKFRPGLEESLRCMEELRREARDNEEEMDEKGKEDEEDKKDVVPVPARTSVEDEEKKDDSSVESADWDSDDQIDPSFLYPLVDHDNCLDDHNVQYHRRGILFWLGLNSQNVRCYI